MSIEDELPSAEDLDTLQPPEAYREKWGALVGLGHCPHCPKLWCWKSPKGWVCQLPHVFAQPTLPIAPRAKKAAPPK
jgi:hypothetical protein